MSISDDVPEGVTALSHGHTKNGTCSGAVWNWNQGSYGILIVP